MHLFCALVVTAAAGPALASADNGGGGDIPDNQVFLTFRDAAAGYSVKYPEGWARQGTGSLVTFADKDNTIRIAVAHGGLPTSAAVRAELRGAKITSAPSRVALPGGAALKVTLERLSPPDPVTNKRVRLTVDRYYIAGRGRLAVLDLGTPVGVDNVDAYRLISRSFHWR